MSKRTPEKDKPIVVETTVIHFPRHIEVYQVVPWPVGTKVRVTIEQVET